MSCLFQNNLQTKNISQWTMRSVSTHRRRMIQQTGTPRTSGKYCVYCTTAVLPTDGVRFSRQGRHRHQASTVCTVLPTDGVRFSRQGRHRHQASTLLYYPQTEDDSADRDATDIRQVLYCVLPTDGGWFSRQGRHGHQQVLYCTYSYTVRSVKEQHCYKICPIARRSSGTASSVALCSNFSVECAKNTYCIKYTVNCLMNIDTLLRLF